MMTMFHAATQRVVGPRRPSAHEMINNAVAPLMVFCTGQENGRLYFERLPGARRDNDTLAQEIVAALLSAPREVREHLGSINTISIKA